MANTKFTLIASTRSEEIIDEIIKIDPYNREFYSQEFFSSASNESEAIREFQNDEIYSQFCERHSVVYTYIRFEGDTRFYRADLIPSAINNEGY